ncbi:hypothetical protein GGR50DRAFT_696687 [Xylaria sp. CBS 124048]|nr:hypothetical protein GGR50DRAFT_696687 [Xylaria sp. CBS 124048]
MKSPWSPLVLLAVWGAPGSLGLAIELETRDGDPEYRIININRPEKEGKAEDGDTEMEEIVQVRDEKTGDVDQGGVKTINSVPSAGQFIRRKYHTVAVVGDYLYIDGGELSARVNGSNATDTTAYNVGTTWSIDLTQSWTNETVNIRSIPKDSPSLGGQTHWIDDSAQSLYTWGGFTIDGSSPSQALWELAADGHGGGSWSQVTQRDYSDFSKLKGTFSTAFTQTKTAGFSFGGAITHASDGSVKKGLPGYAAPGLVSYNFGTGEWKNSSTSSFGGYGTSLNARAEYVPFGPNGLILFIGGSETPVDATNSSIVEMNWNSISMVDPVTNQWYKQRTTGTKPPTIESHCSVGVPGPNGTYEIFIYGGVSDQISGTSPGVYVLSLPGFVFFQGPQDAPSRTDHQCVVVGKGQRQMLSHGGVDLLSKTATGLATPDPWTYGIGVLDMTELKWSDSYDSNAPSYDSPAQVKEWYGAGGLQQVAWDSEAVKDMFTKKATAPAPPPLAPPADNKENGPSTGAIVGGVIGAVVGALFIGLGFLFLIKRSKRKTQARARPHTSQSQRGLAPGNGTQPGAAAVPHKPEPLPKDYLDRQNSYQSSSKSARSYATPYSPSLAPTAVTIEPREFINNGWRSESPMPPAFPTWRSESPAPPAFPGAWCVSPASREFSGTWRSVSPIPPGTGTGTGTGTWRSESPGPREPPGYHNRFIPEHSIELPCTQPGGSESPIITTPQPAHISELSNPNIQIAHELPVPVDTFRMELPDRKYSR